MQVKVLCSLLVLLCFGVLLRGGCKANVYEREGSHGGLLEIKDVILEFIQRKPITMSTIYYCKNVDKMLLAVFMQNGVRANAIDLRIYSPMRTETGLRNGIIVDFRCPDMMRVLQSNADFFQAHQIYALIGNRSFELMMPVLQFQNGVRLDSDISIFTADGRIFDLYKIDNARHADARIMVDENGSWNATGISADFNPLHYKVPTRRNLMNVTVDAVIYMNHKLFAPRVTPWTNYLTDRLDTTHDSSLYHYSMLKMMMKTFNFSVHIRTTDTWTAAADSQNVTGQLGFLYRHQAIFMITPYRMTTDRMVYGDFTAITWEPMFLFLFRHPKTTSIHSKYLVPFKWSVWMTILGLLLLYISIMSIHLQRSGSFETVDDRSFVGVCIWLLGYSFQQYAAHMPNLHSSRIMVVSLILMVYISFQYYCTFIIGSLIMESPKTIKTLDDLISSGLEIGTTKAVYNRDLFVSVADPKMTYIYNELIEKKGNRLDVDEGVERIRQGRMAFHHDSEALYGLIVDSFNDHEICDLAAVSFFRPFPCGMQVAKKSAYRELFFMGLQPMIESGVADMERLKYFTPKPKCVKSEVEVVPVEFDTVTAPILVIVAGMVASLLVLGVEIAVDKILHKLHNGNTAIKKSKHDHRRF